MQLFLLSLAERFHFREKLVNDSGVLGRDIIAFIWVAVNAVELDPSVASGVVDLPDVGSETNELPLLGVHGVSLETDLAVRVVVLRDLLTLKIGVEYPILARPLALDDVPHTFAVKGFPAVGFPVVEADSGNLKQGGKERLPQNLPLLATSKDGCGTDAEGISAYE